MQKEWRLPVTVHLLCAGLGFSRRAVWLQSQGLEWVPALWLTT